MAASARVKGASVSDAIAAVFDKNSLGCEEKEGRRIQIVRASFQRESSVNDGRIVAVPHSSRFRDAMIRFLDVGGEGRFRHAVNLNPSCVQTLGPGKGLPIPRRMSGRADAIPLPAKSVQVLLMERTPLLRSAVLEFRRVVVDGGFIILRHHWGFADPHRVAKPLLGQPLSTALTKIGHQSVTQTVFRNGPVEYDAVVRKQKWSHFRGSG